MSKDHDWSINELFAPVWLDDETCVCNEGVNKPFGAKVSVKLKRSRSFGTGGHPITQNIYSELKRMIKEDDPCLTPDKERNLFGVPRIGEVDAGSGVLMLLAKKLWPQLHAVAVVDECEMRLVEQNKKKNKIRELEIMPFWQFGQDDQYLTLHEKAFNLIITQRGQDNWNIGFDATLSYFHQCLMPSGKVIYGGFPMSELPIAKHGFGEFFRLTKVITHRNYPVLIGEHY